MLAPSPGALLYQRVGPCLWLRATYRIHQQSGVSFFTTAASPTAALRSADSDLAPFIAQTFGGAVGVDLGMIPKLRAVSADFGYERYVRSNNLHVDVFTVGIGFRFL